MPDHDQAANAAQPSLSEEGDRPLHVAGSMQGAPSPPDPSLPTEDASPTGAADVPAVELLDAAPATGVVELPLRLEALPEPDRAIAIPAAVPVAAEPGEPAAPTIVGQVADVDDVDRGDDEETEEATGPVEPKAAGPVEPEAAVLVEPEVTFDALGLSEPVLRAVAERGYRAPTPIQRQAIPFVLMGRDVLGCAQTGTGKTAGFTLPMLDILADRRARARMPRSLILEPTRELALQVAENFVEYGRYLKLNHALLIGGESLSDQREVLNRGVDVLIATPGRLIDLFERGGLLLTDVRILVIDEADRMLDMGFIPDVERIVSLLPRTRQTLFFSATMAPEIRRLADAFLHSPKEITVAPPASVATTIVAGLALVAEHDKREALRRLVRQEQVQNALIFCNRKRDVDILYKSLGRHGFSTGALHGDMTQPMRFATLERFKAGEITLLVCSDVAARGIDIGGLSHVFNFDVPHHAEDYVHRIGRTGRAGREGHAFTLAAPEDRLAVAAIETLIGQAIPRIEIAGLDKVDWAEGDGRRGRGGRGAGTRGGSARGGATRDAGRAAGGERARPPGARPARPARDIAPVDAPAPEPMEEQPAVAAAPVGRGRTRGRDGAREGGREGARNAASARTERGRAEPARSGQGRDIAARGEETGGPIVGFGADIPAFMLLMRRATLPIADDTETVAEVHVGVRDATTGEEAGA